MSHVDVDLSTLTLAKGSHSSRADGTCLLEAVAYFANEPHSDHPACASPVLGVFGRALNDVLPDAKRQMLVPLVPRMVGTADDGLDEARSHLALDWLIRTYTPTWLDLAGLADEAQALRDLRRIVDLASAQAAGPVVRQGAAKVAAARVAARVAARDGARDGAWEAAGEAAREAAWEAAREAAGEAAGEAAWVAARDGAWVAARDAARVAARVAARDALAPTVDALQDSAIALLDAMIAPAPKGGAK